MIRLRRLLALLALVTACAGGPSAPASTRPPTSSAGVSTTAATTTTDLVTTTRAVDVEVRKGESWIAYQQDGERSLIALIRPDGTGQHVVAATIPGGHQTNPDWSPDGNRLTFVAQDDESTEDLWIVDVVTGVAAKVVDCVSPCLRVDDPTWSPDNHTIAFARTAGPFDSTINSLETIDLDTGVTTILLGGDPTVFYAGASWSPGGDGIVLEVVQKDGPGLLDEVGDVALSIVDLTTDPVTVNRLTAPMLFPETAHWSPNGDLIVYAALASPEAGSHELFAISPDGTGLVQLTNFGAGGNAAHPAFNGNGTQVVFVADSAKGAGLAVIGLDGANLGPAVGNGYLGGAHPRVRPES